MKWLIAAWLLLIASAGAFFAYKGFCSLNQHAIEMLDAYKQDALAAKPALENIAQVTAVIEQASQAQAQSAAQIERDIRVETWHLDRSLTALDKTITAYGTIPEHLNKVADAGTETAQAATVTIQAGKPLLEAGTRAVDASTLAVEHFDKLASNPIWLQAGKNIVGMTASGDLILADGSRVSKKLADDYTKKQTPWMRFWHYAGDTYDLGAMLARHTP